VKILAPAKINLGLRIVGVRPDGYHELDSLFLPLDLADTLEVRSAPAAEIEVRLQVDGAAPKDDSNLAIRAARAFCEATGQALRVEIELAKQTPMAAGLGGGSSDAAAVLRALARQQADRLSAPQLSRLALGLGADVPFFLDPRPTRVRGIGERLEPAPDLPSLALVLANPGEGVPTAEAYRAYDALGSTPSPELPELPRVDPLRTEILGPLLRNDLEAAATRLCPAIARLRVALEQAGALAVGLSGSGATLYGVCRDPEAARGVADRLRIPDPGWCRLAITAESR
jgi:4-diphosphocytidyl-2-C-methyl-D-erythritol kinase